MNAKPPLLLVGRIAGSFGVKGEVRLTTYTEDPMALARYRVLLREDGSPALTVETARQAKDTLIVRATGVTDKDQADALRGLRLHVRRDALPEPEEDEFYLADLIGLRAELADGAAFGTVKAVHDFGAGDILEIDPGGGRATVLVPFTKEAVPEVKITEGRLLVVPPAEVE